METAGLSPEDAAAARAAEQARIRKERREAKIKAGGSARLNKITDPIPSFTPPPASTASSPATTPAATSQPAPADQQPHADPDEVDISQHFYQPQTTNRIPTPTNGSGDPIGGLSENQLRQMMLGFDPTSGGGGGNPRGADEPDPAEDPMLKLLQQMMGGAGGAGGMPPFGGQNNPFAAGGAGGAGGPFGAMGMGMGQPQQQQQQKQATDSYAAVWRLLHFVVALGLGLYIALLTSFSGTKIARERDAVAAGFGDRTAQGGGGGGGGGSDVGAGAGVADDDDLRRYFFWAFATAETVLLTTRFFLDRSRGPQPGMLGTIMGFLPEGAWKGYLGVGLRYAQIFSTVRSDMLVCVFVLGICAWVRS